MLNKLLGEIHVAVQIAKRHLRFDHPELARVPGRVGVLSAKSRSKRVNLGQCQRECFCFQLTAHGQISWPGEKIFRIIDFAFRGSRHVRGVQRCDAKQFSGSLAVASGNDWRVHINETSILKELMNGKSQAAPHTKHAAEKIRSRPEMSDFTK